MKCVITVFGKDKVGIIAKTCAYLSEVNINILDISQTIVDGYFNMMMIVDISKISKPMEVAAEELKGIGKELGVIVSMQHEDIFNCMHRI
ncbi:ACT domain-containing protein [uncultured Fusobacterium sp.]|jgi:ACT domain-containing protein|uniref:ACT domain-containing protein n=1 Tax=uncultured Fusobacterium sp. TaxID=159267 RepID=UPI0025EF20DD|nr:ACT domain-containing protein [uncultured Fusobacterium sp.]MCF2640381.1 ACT domain-containing protein [Fusobacterium varium]